MENKLSKEYITQLLKQLEDLKKKKARKEKKLQKLKSSARGDQASRNFHPLLNKTSVQTVNAESSTHLVDVENNYNDPHRYENCLSFNDSKCAKIVDSAMKNDEGNYSYGKLDVEHGLRRNNVKTSKKPKYNERDSESLVQTINSNTEKNDSVYKNFAENESCHAFTNSAHSKFNFLTVKESKSNFLDDKCDSSEFDDHFICSGSIEKVYREVEESKFNGSDIHNIQDSKDSKSAIVMSVEAKVVPFPTCSVMKEDSMLNTSYEKLHNSNKSLLKSKISSDILDDSLNSNMSYFLSSEFFLANDEKKEIINEDKSTVASTHEKLEQIEASVEVITSDPIMTFPIVADPVSVKNNQNDFNFPKFSTPTDGIFFLSSSEENVLNSQAKSAKQCVSDDVRTVSYITEDVCDVNKACIGDIQPENKFDPLQISLILGKGVASVLDAHYESPKKPVTLKNKILSNITHGRKHSQEIIGETSCKRQKLFSNTSVACLEQQSKADDRIGSSNSLHSSFENLAKTNKVITDINLEDIDAFPSNSGSFDEVQNSPTKGIIASSNSLHGSFENLAKIDKAIIDGDINLVGTDAFPSNSGSFDELQNSPVKNIIFESNSTDDVESQIIKTIDALVTEVCDGHVTAVEVDANMNDETEKNMKVESEILIVPETEGLGLYFSKDTEDFLNTSTLSESLKDFHVKDRVLNMPTQSKLESPVLNKIVQAVKLAKENSGKESCNCLPKRAEEKESFDNSLAMDTSFLEDDTQELGIYKQIPYLNEKNSKETLTLDDSKKESNFNFICSLYGASNEAVIDVEVVVFSSVKYAFIQHRTQIHVWRQEKKKEWIKIFNHQTEDMLSLVKICVTMDKDNLVVVMLLSNDEQYCLQFLLFERDARVIKVMENTHWLEKRHSEDSVLLCGLDGLMFATAQVKKGHEVSLHAFINLKECPRLMTAVLGSTDCTLCSLCKINKLPNALIGINDSMLYVWHVQEARLVTAVSLHPHDYLPIKECFWATVENGLIYLLTTCESQDKHQVCQLLVANLATGFCQSAMTYSSQPSRCQVAKITKAVYMEPFIVVSHLNGAFLWSVTEEYCCAALSSKSDTTSVAISRDFENWGLIVVGSKLGYITCYGLN